MLARPTLLRAVVVASLAATSALAGATAPLAAPSAVSSSPGSASSSRALATVHARAAGRTSSLAVARPAAVRAGDVLVAAVAVRASGRLGLRPPPGWRLVRRDASRSATGSLSQALYVRVAGAGEPRRYAWRWHGRHAAAAAVIAYRGIDRARPLAGHGGRAARQTSSAVAPSIRAGTAEPVVVAFFAGSGGRALAAPSGLAVRYRAAVGTIRRGLALAGGDAAGASSGATGRRVARLRSGSRAATIGQVLALRPAGSGSAPVPAPPALAGGRWFSDASPLNTPIPAGAAVDPSSSAMTAGMEYAAAQKGFSVSVKRWSVPVYYADRTTPRTSVALDAPWTIPAHQLLDVPFPADARPDPAGDMHMAVIDRDSGCFYEYYKLFRREDGGWQARWANRGALDGPGIHAAALSTRASGFANLAGLIRPEELERGSIDHALVFGHPFTKAGGPVLPATDSDGRPESETGAAVGLTLPAGALPIPEGARVQLDPGLDLDSLGLAPWQRVIARALQVYGMYLADTAGTTSLTAVNPQSFASNPYLPFWGDEAYAYLPPALLRHMRVLQLGPQFAPTRELASSACGEMR
ncbi:MAG TPA: hypothetical protein VLB86_05035 [Gaiellaceae bacterium]|nr:hypothetical protein [Gaiellaceae bacterium]